ncbi:unnamed protein product [Bursaphelenchus okinawaensis]|uniref:Transthyretin-like family protein n=1 Tax=Bursaphelenchus okinawaensis TaxID=465554 RepID=A0A811K912_9BILA|nr:unnamed protein product [Bursaphelenchus okinawaensis]CAG9094585.1 unnamed protein product [Bursaphelenchus okinawaensis]
MLCFQSIIEKSLRFTQNNVVVGIPNLFGTEQSAAVRGVLKCNGEGAAKVKVKLYDVDRTDLDDLMAEGETDSDGRFELSGRETEYTSIDPKLNIYHKCRDPDALCFKKIEIVIPDSFISQGKIAKKTFDIGELNLNAEYGGETADCFN